MNKILLSIGVFLAVLSPIALPVGIFENQAHAESAAKLIQDGASSTGQQDTRSAGDIAKDTVNIMFFVIGILAVIMIIWGGIRYVLSAGNSTALTNAKNTIVYAVIGLIVAILAYAIVNFVVNTVAGNGNSGGSSSSSSSSSNSGSNNNKRNN